jgi:hypothetical protein
MDRLKTILALIAVILLALVALALIGFFYYVLLFGLICLAAVIVVRFLTKPGFLQIDAPDPNRDRMKVKHTLEEYERKRLLK